jgi:hypothetical protein
MRKYLLALPLALVAAAPADATGGFVCRTAGARPIQVSVGFGHVPGSPLILTRLTDSGRNVAVQAAQWWLDNDEMRLLLIDPGARGQQLLLKARRNGFTYDGSVWRSGQRRWVRCRED